MGVSHLQRAARSLGEWRDLVKMNGFTSDFNVSLGHVTVAMELKRRRPFLMICMPISRTRSKPPKRARNVTGSPEDVDGLGD